MLTYSNRAGLQPAGKSRSECRDDGNQGGQVYARVGTSNGRTAVLYSWYIPKVQTSEERHRHFYLSIVVWLSTKVCNAANGADFGAEGITYSMGSDVAAWEKTKPRSVLYTVGDNGDGNTHAVIGYDGQVNLYPATVHTEWDLSPPLISWAQLSQAARDQFNGIVYEKARCPFSDANFQATLDAAYAEAAYADVAEDPAADCGEAVTTPTPTDSGNASPTTTVPPTATASSTEVNTDPVEDGDDLDIGGAASALPADPTFTPSTDARRA